MNITKEIEGMVKEKKNNKDNKFKSFLKRSISGIFLVAFLIIVLVLGGNVLLISLGILSSIAFLELLQVFKLNKTVFSYLGISFIIFYEVNILHFYVLVFHILL